MADKLVPQATQAAHASLSRLAVLQAMIRGAGDGAFTVTFQGLRAAAQGERAVLLLSSGTVLPLLLRELEEEREHFNNLAEDV